MRRSRLPCVVYVAFEEGGPSKIGVAVDAAKRIKIVARQCERPVRLVWSVPYADCRRAETLVCRILERRRHRGFRVEGNREWFDVPPELVIAAAERAIRILDTGDRAALRSLGAPGFPRRPKSKRASRKRHDSTDRTLRTIATLDAATEQGT